MMSENGKNESYDDVNAARHLKRPKDPSELAHGTCGLQPERDGRVRCGGWSGVAVVCFIAEIPDY